MRLPLAHPHAALAALTTLAALAAPVACGAPEPAPVFLPPGTSVVMITLDTLRADHLSRNRSGRATTPYLDALAEEGIYCSRSYAQSSWTLPSMLSLISSLSPPVFGVTEGVKPLPKPGQGDRGPDGEQAVAVEYFSEAYVTLAEVLAEHGFATAGFSSNGHLSREQGFAQGFAHFDQTSCMWGSAACVLTAARSWLDAYLGEPRERPFFLWAHLFDPHFDERFKDSSRGAPLYRPERGYEDLFGDGEGAASIEERTRLDYDRKIRYADDRIRDFVEGLRAQGVLDRAVLVVAADHGEEFNEHGLWGHSKSVRNTLVHVPLLFRFPAASLTGDVSAVVRNLDIAPTLLDFLAVPAPAGMEGRSLLPLFRGQERAALPPPAYGETRRFAFDLRYRIDPALDRKLVLDLASGSRWLFSLSQDPGERTDLAALEPGRADAMERALRAAIDEMEARAQTATRTDTMSDEEVERLRRLGYIN